MYVCMYVWKHNCMCMCMGMPSCCMHLEIEAELRMWGLSWIVNMHVCMYTVHGM